MRKTISLLLAILLLLSQPMSVHAEDDPFDIGPIEPFEDTPDWLPEEEPGQPPENNDGDAYRLMVIIDSTETGVIQTPTGDLILDFTMNFFARTNLYANRDFGGMLDTYLAMSMDGKIELKGIPKSLVKVDSTIKGTFEPMEFEMSLLPMLIISARKTDAVIKTIEDAYGKKFGDDIETGPQIVGFTIDKEINLDGQGSFEASVILPNASGHTSNSGQAGAPVKLTLNLLENGVAEAIMILPKATEMIFKGKFYLDKY